MAKITEDKIQEMIRLYEDGNTFTNISKIMNIDPNTVSKYLKSKGIARKRFFDRLTEEERLEICDLYLENKWDEIFKKYKFMTKNRVYHLTGEMGVKKDTYFWTKEDEKLLINNYGKSYDEIAKMMDDRHSAKAISTKAIKMGLTSPQEWTQKEIDILEQYYSSTPKEEFEKMLPNRTTASIICKAGQLKIKSYQYLNEKYSDEEKQFIINNYETMTDIELAKALNKPLSGIQEQRRKLGIYYSNKDYSGYENLVKLFRGHIQEWKNKSMESCNYKCILTGDKDFAIHHLYGFNIIIKEVFEELSRLDKLKINNIEDYSKEELDFLLNVFSNIHNKYPLGICIRKDIHNLFHKIYGSGGNTEIQWKQFVTDYNNHKYDNELVA